MTWMGHRAHRTGRSRPAAKYDWQDVGASEYGEVDFRMLTQGGSGNKNPFVYEIQEGVDVQGLDKRYIMYLALSSQGKTVFISDEENHKKSLKQLMNSAFEDLGAERTGFSSIFKKFNGREVPEGIKATLGQGGMWNPDHEYRHQIFVPVEIQKTPVLGNYKVIPTGGACCKNPHFDPNKPHETYEPS